MSTMGTAFLRALFRIRAGKRAGTGFLTGTAKPQTRTAHGLLGRYSISAAVFDADRNTLYYYELDT